MDGMNGVKKRIGRKVNRQVTNELKQLIFDVVSRIVDHPDEVEVNVIPTTYKLIAELHTNPGDVGQVVGRGGEIAKALRSVVAAFGGRAKIRCEVEYVTEREKAMGAQTAP